MELEKPDQLSDGAHRYINVGDKIHVLPPELSELHHHNLASRDGLHEKIDELLRAKSPEVNAGHIFVDKQRGRVIIDRLNEIHVPVRGKEKEALQHTVKIVGNIFPGWRVDSW